MITNTNPELSIILLLYNGEKYLDKCLSSLSHQSYQNFELLIIDDGSTDNSLKIIDKYKLLDQRISVFTFKHENSDKNLNAAIYHAKGNYIFQIDQDDYISNNFLLNLMKCFNDNSIDCVSCSYTIVDENEKKLNWYTPNFIDSFKLEGIDAAKYFLTNCHNVEGFRWNKITRKSVFTENNLKYNAKLYPPDLAFKLGEFINCRNVFFLNESGYFYRQHNDSDVKSLNVDRYLSFFSVYKHIYNEAIRYNLKIEAEFFYLQYSLKMCYNIFKKRKSILGYNFLRKYISHNITSHYNFLRDIPLLLKFCSGKKLIKSILCYIIVNFFIS